MESIRRTYAHCIKPVPSPKFWVGTEFSKPDPPIIKSPIGRPKDVSSSQPGSSPNPTVVESPATTNPTMPPAPTRVTRSTLIISPPGPTATQTRPPAPTIGRPFQPPGKANDTSRPQQSRFRPKQKISRPSAPITASTINTNTQQPTPSTIPFAAPNQEAPSQNLPTSPKTKDSKE
ncbi:extensin-like [Arachis stenosperma]|uniref:extensin-like n=1 Tax=Arachis stenosperma TaxID=217475 RepID=UPI0025AB87F9|nr:extensin-like [Arachis stenosperma]